MTADQFEALRQLSGWHSDSQRVEALRLHLVEGIPQADAARFAGVKANNLGHAVTAARRTIQHAERLVGKSKKT